MARLATPVFESVTVFAALVVPCGWLPKVRVPGDTPASGTVPVPESGIDCVAGLPFSELSVRTAALRRGPLVTGVKLMLRLQVAPGASAKLLVQSAGVPVPATCAKFVPIVRPGVIAFND